MPDTVYRMVAKSTCAVAVPLLLASLCVGQTAGKQSTGPAPTNVKPVQTTLKELLLWLPEDTETLVGTNGPFPFPDFSALNGNNFGQSELPETELELRIHAIPLSLLSLNNGGLRQFLTGKVVSLALEGSRHFRPPGGLGLMKYEGCEIVVFDSSVTSDGDTFMKSATNSAVRVDDMAGVRIAVFEEHQENDVWTTFVGFARSNMIVVATNADYLRAVLTRMSRPSGPRALPDTLQEWKFVDTRAPVWGLRHYNKSEAGLDPTSPFSGPAAANAPDNLAVGLGFSFEPANRRMATVTYLSGNTNARQVLPGFLGAADAQDASPREFQIRLRQPAPNAIEGTVALAIPEAVYRFLLGLEAMLGHAVYL